ncbi:cytochrome c oxidase subunit II [Nibrella saemangeumensis]|uniref:Cytochrome c oxidase subunit 2 n=1 Tax=Nibrella saemangeumensis TaxID=1084526 RepID=A0ABP8NNJ1_9BACT
MVYIVGLLSLVFLVLTILVIARLSKVLRGVNGTSRPLEEDGGGRIDIFSNRINGAMFLVFLVGGTIAMVWSYLVAQGDFLPEASSPHGRRLDGLFWLSMAIVTAAFFITNTLLFYFAWKYQYKEGKRATYYPENHKLELIWTVVPAVVMALLVFTGWRAWRDIMSEAPADSMVYEIVGKQFNWIVRYPGADDNKLGAFNYKLIDNNNELGLDFSDEAAFDDFTSTTELHIPVNKPVLLKIRARDVLHSVFIPHLRVKMDAVPGMPTRFWFVADKTTDEMKNLLNNQDFTYEIACTEVCGRGHFSMRIRLIVEDEESYNKWVSEQKPLLSTFPEYASRIPDNLKAKAAKYLQGAAPTENTTAATTEEGGGAAASASLR